VSELCGISSSPKDEELMAKGWVKQFTCGEPRLSESCELFESMGREVHLEKMRKENQPMGAECDLCFMTCGDDMMTIWTRVKQEKPAK